jgi:hypothetical protein
MAPTTKSRFAADVFAASVGEQPSALRVASTEWAEYLKECCRITVHVTRWHAETTLKLSDLGIEAKSAAEAKALASVLKLGKRNLLPARVLAQMQSLENKFRNWLAKCSIETETFGTIVPKQRYTAWRDTANSIAQQYLGYAQWVYEHWDELQAEMRDDYRHLGWSTAQRLTAMGKLTAEPGAWVEAFVERCMAKSETPEHWLSRAAMYWDPPTFITLPEPTSDEQHAAAVAQAKSEMERDILEGAKPLLDEGLFQFMGQVRGTLTSLVFDSVVDVLETMDREKRYNKKTGSLNARLPRNSSKQLKNLIAAVNDLKFWADESLDAKLAKIQGILDQRSNDRDYDEMETVLRDLGAEARMLLFDLGKPVARRSKQIGIPHPEDGDNITGTIRKGRLEMPIIEDAVIAPPVRGRQIKLELVQA